MHERDSTDEILLWIFLSKNYYIRWKMCMKSANLQRSNHQRSSSLDIGEVQAGTEFDELSREFKVVLDYRQHQRRDECICGARAEIFNSARCMFVAKLIHLLAWIWTQHVQATPVLEQNLGNFTADEKKKDENKIIRTPGHETDHLIFFSTSQ